VDVDPKQFVDRMYRPKATPAQVEAAFKAAGFFNIVIDYHPAYRPGGQQYPDGDGYWAVIFMKDNVTSEGVRQETDVVLDGLGLRTEETMPTYAFDWQPDEPMQRSGTLYLPGSALVKGPTDESEEPVDPKGFIERTHRHVAGIREVELAFEYGGFSDVHLTQVSRSEDPYWMIWGSAMGDQAKVEKQATDVLADIGLNLIEMRGSQNGNYWTVYMSVPNEQIDSHSVAEAIVDALIEDVDADLPSHKSEVRILPTKDPRRFDVTLLTGFKPIYIGTLGHQGSLWKPVEIMPGVGRQLRSKLHFVGPDKEAVAMTMVQALRPIWKRQITQHLYAQLESEDEVDPKGFVNDRVALRDWNLLLVREPDGVMRNDKPTASNSLKAGDYWIFKNGKGQVFTLGVRFEDTAHRHAFPRRGRIEWDVKVGVPGRGRSRVLKTFEAGTKAEAFQIAKDMADRYYMRVGESDDVDPKGFVQQKIGHDIDIRRIIETNYPNIEVLRVVPDTGYRLRYVATIRSKDQAAPLWHQPIYALIRDLELKLWDLYNWKMRPYANQQNYPANIKTRGVAGIKPISVCYNNTPGQPGAFDLMIDFDIMKPDKAGGYAEQENWGTPYESVQESDEVDPKKFVTDRVKYVYIVRESDGMDRWLNKTAWPRQKVNTAIVAVFRHKQNALNYASNLGGKVYSATEDSPGVRAWLSTGQPIRESLAAEIEKEAEKAEKPASPEQAEAGNYRKGHISFQGLDIAIENAEGSTRSGTGKDGKKWSVTMPAHYGYIKGTKGKDKDHLDVYIGPKPNGMMVFVVNQKKEEGGFDEHKIMLGFASKDEAIATYDRAFSGNLGPKLRETVVSTTVDKLKEWIASGNTKKPFEGLAESLLEAEEEFGLNDFKALAMRAADGVKPGTQFHIGFAIHTSNQHDIEMRANDDDIEVDWDAVNAAIPVIERNVLMALNEQGIHCIGEGHNDDELIGSAWVEAGTGAVAIIKEFVDRDEPFSTTSGNIDHIQQGLGLRAYQGVPENIAMLIDVSVSFFDLDTVKQDTMDGGLGLGESDDNIKRIALSGRIRTPSVWGDLNVGDVLFDHETGCYEQVYALKFHRGQYQGVDGAMGYDSSPAEFRLYKQFGPAYAYGHYIQHLSAHPKQGLFGAELVDVADTSDEGLWKLVDEELYRNGTTPEELEQSRAEHRARQAAEPDRAAARRRMAELMGQVPPPPQNESDDLKSFLGRHELPVELVEISENVWQVIRKDDNYLLGQLHFSLHDDAPSQEAHENWKDTNWIALPITPSVEPKGFKDQDEALRFLLANGNR
jgi:hypothetical protein